MEETYDKLSEALRELQLREGFTVGEENDEFDRLSKRQSGAANGIKRAKERLESEGMLSIAEEVVLEQGVLHLGTDWAAIRAAYLPHRDEEQLRHT